jgi:hypothetical protein
LPPSNRQHGIQLSAMRANDPQGNFVTRQLSMQLVQHTGAGEINGARSGSITGDGRKASLAQAIHHRAQYRVGIDLEQRCFGTESDHARNMRPRARASINNIEGSLASSQTHPVVDDQLEPCSLSNRQIPETSSIFHKPRAKQGNFLFHPRRVRNDLCRTARISRVRAQSYRCQSNRETFPSKE